MIIKNNNEVRKIYFGTSPAPMFNYNGSKAFQHIVDEYVPPVFTCPDVVQSIVGYEGDAKEVYAKDTEKWYMRNNLGNYEEYGILEEVQTLADATFYEGKLVIFDNHEYESVGGDWVDLGAAQGTTKKIKSPSYIYNDSSHLFSIPTEYTASTSTKLEMKFKATNGNGGAILGSNSSTDQDDFRIFLSSNTLYYNVPSTSGSYGGRIYGGSYLGKDADIEFGNFYIKDLSTGTNVVTGATQTYQCDSTLIVGQSTQFGHDSNDTFQLSALTMYHGDTLERDFIPAIDGNDICLYDKVSDAYFKSDNGIMPLYGGTITEVEVGTIEYPKDYETKDAPEDNVTVESLDQIECPYEGMTAYVNGVKYTYENGEWIEHTETDWSQEYLTFEAIDDCQFKLSRNTAVSCFYSLDNGNTWTGLANNTYTPTIQAGQTIKWKADITPRSSTTAGDAGVGTFSSTGMFNAMGNPYSLMSSNDFRTIDSLVDKIYALSMLFQDCTNLVSAENLSLPANTLSQRCYAYMFRRCSSLTTAPELPAMVLGQYCYEQMFNRCTSLTSDINLPATDWDSSMGACYEGMLENTLVTVIRYMMLAQPPTSNLCFNWVNGVASSGTFVKNKNATWSNSYGVSAIPQGWTVELSE